ncbi:MAG: response regulator [Actinobacteria bacterium]|nr:response regulator [Actinomycetota bacterium]
MSTVLLVEDDERLRRALALTLRARGYTVTDVATGREALAEASHRKLDAIVLDLGLPDLDGLEVIRRVRESSALPIVVLSARRDESDKVQALDAGADDYMTKPFGVDELLARLRAAVRRSGRGEDQRVVATPDFTIDLGRKTLTDRSLAPIHLTPTEWGVLETLVRANGLLVTSADLLSEVWGPGYEEQTNYLRVYVGQLRRKIEPDVTRPRYLLTTPGIGYRFDASGATPTSA